MSSLAVVELGGEALTAWEYRSFYLKHGTIYKEFYCPFCEVPLFARLIYKDEELKISPSFAHFRGNPHKLECDGEAIPVSEPKINTHKTQMVPRDMHYPEAFVDRPPPRVSPIATSQSTTHALTESEIFDRRKSAGSHRKSTPSAHLLQPIVEAYNSVLSEAYELYIGENKKTERSEWINTMLAGMKLRLEDSTTYKDAFKSPSWVHQYKRIYHERGKVVFENSKFIILGKYKMADSTAKCITQPA